MLWGVRAKCSHNRKSRCRGPEAGGWHVWWRIEAPVTGVQWDGLERKAGAMQSFDMGLGIPIWSRVQWKMERHWCGVRGEEAGSWSGVPHKSPEALGREGSLAVTRAQGVEEALSHRDWSVRKHPEVCTSSAGVNPHSLISAVTADKRRITSDNSHRCNFYLAFPEPI